MDDISEELREFLKQVAGGEGSSEYAKELAGAVKLAKANMEWRRQYMLLYMRDLEKKAEGRAEGRANERERINALNKALTAADRMDDLKRSLEDPEFQNKLLQEYGL